MSSLSVASIIDVSPGSRSVGWQGKTSEVPKFRQTKRMKRTLSCGPLRASQYDSAVHRHHLPGDICGPIRTQKGDGFANILRSLFAPQWRQCAYCRIECAACTIGAASDSRAQLLPNLRVSQAR